MVNRFRSQRPMSRAERETEFGQEGPQFWWKDEDHPPPPAPSAPTSLMQGTRISSRALSSSSADYDGALMEDVGLEAGATAGRVIPQHQQQQQQQTAPDQGQFEPPLSPCVPHLCWTPHPQEWVFFDFPSSILSTNCRLLTFTHTPTHHSTNIRSQ